MSLTQPPQEDLYELFNAVHKSDAKQLRALLKTIKNPNQAESYWFTFGKRTLLQYAVQNNDNSEVVEVLLQDPRINPNQRTYNGKTPLHFAAEQNNSEIIKILLEDKRVDANITYNGKTAKDMTTDKKVKRLFPISFFPKDKENSQTLLIKHMQALGYRADTLGVCYGIAHMGMQAMLLEERDYKNRLTGLDNFNNRYIRMRDISYEVFRERIEELEQNRIKHHVDIRKRVNSYSIDELKQEYNSIQQELGLNTTDINQNNNLNSDDLSVEKMRTFIIRKKMADSDNAAKNNEKHDLEMRPFFEGIELYHHTYKYAYLFEEGKKPPADMQSGQLAVPLVLSQALEGKGGIANIDRFSGVYNQEELSELLESLEKHLAGFDHPISLVLGGSDHAISIGYDPVEKNWMFVDANKLPAQKDLNTKSLSEQVIKAFSKNGITAFSTEIYAAKHTSKDLQKRITDWKNEKQWQRIHTVSSKKANLTEASGSFIQDIISGTGSWLKVAIMNGEPDLAKELMKKQGFFKRHWKSILAISLGVSAFALAGIITFGTLPIAAGLVAGLIGAGIGIANGIREDKSYIAKAEAFSKSKMIPSTSETKKDQENIDKVHNSFIDVEYNANNSIEMKSINTTNLVQRKLKEAQFDNPPPPPKQYDSISANHHSLALPQENENQTFQVIKNVEESNQDMMDQKIQDENEKNKEQTIIEISIRNSKPV